MLAQSTRPKCKADTYYIPMSDGVYLRKNNSRLILKGKSLYRLLEHLIPSLDGNVTLEEITRGLDADRERMVTNLLEKLFAHDFLKDTSQDQLHQLSPVELETYAPDIAFIESFQTSAASRFELFRNKRLLLIGSGLHIPSLLQASLQCGVKQVSAILTREDESDASSPEDLLALLSSEQTVQLIESPSWIDEAETRTLIQAYDAILHLADQSGLARAQVLNRLCIEEQKTCIQAILLDNYAWIGPLVSPETENCWECAWRRVQANLSDLSEQLPRYEFSDQPSASTDQPLALSEATMIANRLLFPVFQHFTQANALETTGKLSVIDLATSLSESHTFLPHPHCLACQHPVPPTASQFLEQIQRLQQQHPVEPDRLLENVVSCVDERFGLFSALEGDSFAQVPLSVYRIHLSNPLLKQAQFGSLNVTAAAIDSKRAGIRVAQKACESYAANVVDQRRLLPMEIVQQGSHPVISASQLLEVETLPAEGELWSWALDLHAQQAALLPAAHVFPVPHEQGRGIASGLIWEEAICQALLDWCHHLTVSQLEDTQQAYRQVDLEETPMTPEGRHFYGLLKVAVGQVTAYDITGTLQVPTFAICLDEKIVAYSTHCNEAQALSMGLEQALQQYQSELFQQPDYALAPVPDFPMSLRGEQVSVPRYSLPEEWSARVEWLLQRLQANGLRAFAIPLDHDPALARIFPFIMRVLVGRSELKEGE